MEQAILFGEPGPPKPAEKKGGMQLRYYQQEAVDACFDEWRSGLVKRLLIVAATGLGKTVKFCEVVKRWEAFARQFGLNPRVMVIAHRSELIYQAQKRIAQHCNERVAVEKAEEYASGGARIVVASVQTVSKKKRLERMVNHGGFGLIVIDECHRSVSKSYRNVVEAMPEARLLGVTATPDRSDGKALGKVFEKTVFKMDILGDEQEPGGIDSGFLVPIDGKRVTIDDIHLESVPTKGKDFDEKALDEEMAKNMVGIIDKLVELVPMGTRQGIIFTPGVNAAHYAASLLNQRKEGCAVAIDGKTDPFIRSRAIAWYARGEIQWLVNCAIFTEGFDAPSTSVIVQARPTKSRSLYTQMVGRGTRVLPGVVDNMADKEQASQRREAIAASKKPEAVVYDFVGNGSRHSLGLASMIDVLAGDMSDKERKAADKLEDEERGKDLSASEVIREARKLAREQARKAAKVKRMNAKVEDFDPFKIAGTRDSSERFLDGKYGAEPATNVQIAALIKFGFKGEDVRGISRRTANKLFKGLGERRKKGLATLKQLNALKRMGLPVKDIEFDLASKVIDYAMKRGNRFDRDAIMARIDEVSKVSK